MNTIQIHGVQLLPREYIVEWSATPLGDCFRHAPFRTRYESNVPPNALYPTQQFLSVILPIYSAIHKQVVIVSPFTIHADIQNYWERIFKVIKMPKSQTHWFSTAPDKQIGFKTTEVACGRPGILFGGGVESSFAVYSLERMKPVLLSLTGENMMNNRPNYQVKKELENELIRIRGLNLQRVTTNAYSLLRRGDCTQHRFTTGLLMYWSFVPLSEVFRLNVIYKGSELEEALDYGNKQNIALHPTSIKHFSAPGEAMFLPLFNCYPKIEMMAELSKTDFIKYVYSCLNNTKERWCGKCFKCARMSAYCHYLNIDPAIIGMRKDIPWKPETGEVTKYFWSIAERLYGKRMPTPDGVSCQPRL
jgi:hypothetical protein